MRIDRTLHISVHIPKTAGTSFKSSLVASIGSDYLFFDYNHSNAFSYLSLLGVAPGKLHKTWLLDKRFNYSTVEQIASNISPLTKFIHGHFPGHTQDEDVMRLQKENAELRMEREILKKALRNSLMKRRSLCLKRLV